VRRQAQRDDAFIPELSANPQQNGVRAALAAALQKND